MFNLLCWSFAIKEWISVSQYSCIWQKSWYIAWMQACDFGKNVDLSLAVILFSHLHPTSPRYKNEAKMTIH